MPVSSLDENPQDRTEEDEPHLGEGGGVGEPHLGTEGGGEGGGQEPDDEPHLGEGGGVGEPHHQSGDGS